MLVRIFPPHALEAWQVSKCKSGADGRQQLSLPQFSLQQKSVAHIWGTGSLQALRGSGLYRGLVHLSNHEADAFSVLAFPSFSLLNLLKHETSFSHQRQKETP